MPINVRTNITTSDDTQKPFDDLESTGSVANNNTSRDKSLDSKDTALGRTITDTEIETLSHFQYDATQDQLVGDRAIETTLNSLFLGEQHKMSSGAENIFFTNLGNNTNFFPMWGGLKDQSITANQGSSGFIPPSGRVYTDMFSLPLGGSPDPITSIGYTGGNYFAVSIAGLGITTTLAEEVEVGVSLEYKLSVNDVQVYKQILPTTTKRYPNDLVEWFFDHPVEIHAGTTIFAEIRKVDRSTDTDYGVLQVRMGDDGTNRYQAIVHNRLFEDKDLELISPYLKYQAMDFSLDATGSSIVFKDLSLGSNGVLVSHAINTVEAVANGSNITIKIKGGQKILVENVPVSGVSVNGSFVNSVLNQAVTQLNSLFTNTLGFSSSDTFVNGFTLSGNDLTLSLNDGTSYTTDVTTLGVDENNFVASGVLSGSNLILTMDNASTVTVDASGLAIDENVTVTSGTVSGTDLVLTLSDATTVTIDASTLGGSGSSGNPVVSGSVIGTNLVLVLDDASQITIDASNMINGSSGLASSSGWFISYGTDANDAVGYSTINSVIRNQQPFYFGELLTRGSEFRWNVNTVNQQRWGIWSGSETANTFTNGVDLNNWNTCFSFLNGGTRFVDGVNTSLLTGTQYVVSSGDALGIRFGNDGHLTLIDYSNASPVEIAKTDTPLSVNEFNMQYGAWQLQVFPNVIINNVDYIWDIVHDFDNSENGVIDGVEDHTVIQSAISIGIGEKIMFNLDEYGRNVNFGTSYIGGSSSGLSVAEEELANRFIYMSNESLNFEFFSTSEWNVNTNSTYYFNNGAGVVGYRKGSTSGTTGTNLPQGMFSLRFNNDGKLTIYSEDNNEKVATAKIDPQVGSSVNLCLGFTDSSTSYSAIPAISKQTIGQGSQPDVNFVPTVADQTVSVTEGDVLNFQIISSDNIVNQFVESDAPSWISLNQNSGILSGTAPAYLGTSADTIVVNCKAGNAIGGTINFTVTVTVAQVAYTNTNSLNFNGTTTFLQGNPVNMNALERASNGDGNAWSISMWVKPSSNTANQTLFVYGAGDDYNGGAITLKQSGGTSLVLNYGTVYDNIIIVAANSFVANTWQHILITFDGGTTGSVPADASNYYGRFNVLIDGVFKTKIGVASGGGYDGVISGSNPSDNIFRIGRASNVHNNYYDGTINQIAIWDTDQTANVSTIYNSGAVQNLSTLTTAPAHYYEIETSVTTIADIEDNADLTGYNFVNANLANNTP